MRRWRGNSALLVRWLDGTFGGLSPKHRAGGPPLPLVQTSPGDRLTFPQPRQLRIVEGVQKLDQGAIAQPRPRSVLARDEIARLPDDLIENALGIAHGGGSNVPRMQRHTTIEGSSRLRITQIAARPPPAMILVKTGRRAENTLLSRSP